MSVLYIYYSNSGRTKSVIDKIRGSIEGYVIEVKPEIPYPSIMKYPQGCIKAIRGKSEPVIPGSIDVSGYCLVVIASPVWAGRPTSVINGAIDALSGCKDKRTYAIMTCNDAKSGNMAIDHLKDNLKKHGLEVCGQAVLDKKIIESGSFADEIISELKSCELS